MAGFIGFHAPVVICDKKNDKLSDVDRTWTIVVESALEGQIGQIYKNED